MPQHIYELLVKLMGTHDPFVINQWWITPNRGLGGICPVDANVEHVVSYLMGHIEGGW